MNFQEARARLLATLQDRIHNGDLTENGLARLTGVSQPHVHNVLKGIRTLTPGIFDLILKVFNLSLLDLSSRQELENQLESLSGPHLTFEVPILLSPIGPQMPWPSGLRLRERYPVPTRGDTALDDLLLARLIPDERMATLLEDFELAALDVSERARINLLPGAVYVIEREAEAILRYLRHGRACLYAVDADSLNQPADWEPLPLPETGIRGLVRAKVIWVGREKSRYSPLLQRGRFLADATS